MADAPVFLIGAARSGTSLLYKCMCLHPDTAWISNWVRIQPTHPSLGVLNRTTRLATGLRRKVWFGSEGSNAYRYGEHRSPFERGFPQPVEGEPVFASVGIPELPDGRPTSDQQIAALRKRFEAIRAASGGRVLVNKRIANNLRLPLLHAAFPDARFVEIVRDGRAVAASLHAVDWWADSKVWFTGGTPREWEAAGKDPWELCARNWVEELAAIEEGRAGVPDEQWISLSYEDFTSDPLTHLSTIGQFAGLRPGTRWMRDLGTLHFPDQKESWRKLPPEVVATFEQIQRDTLIAHGYVV